MRKMFVLLMVLVAIVVAFLGLFLSREHLAPVIAITNFFDIMIPILAVAALINYLWKTNCCCHHDKE